jgi:two-component system, response regulator / RNA-binding antiterminator
MPDKPLRILIIDQNLSRGSIIEEGLRDADHHDVVVLRDTHNLLRNIVDLDPDVIFIDLENPNRDVLEQMFQVSRIVHRPVAMFVDRSDASMIEKAIEAGVGAYVVDGLRKERVKPILDTCISRFNAFSKLRDELDKTRRALEERKLVDRAKGILMKERRLGEEEAYALLRQAAMEANMRLGEMAQSVINAARLLR